MAAKKILVADDSLTIQKVIRLALSNEGYEIHAVSDGKDALEQISLLQPHAVLIDVSLPGQSAFEIKRAVNTHDDLTGIKFILMSSAFESVDEVQAEEVKFDGRLIKPFDPAHLRQILSKVFEGMAPRPTPPPSKPAAASPPPPPSSMPKAPPSKPSVPQYSRPEELLADEFPPPVPAEAEPEPTAPAPSNYSDRTDTEIQRLTESTIRMSGLDEFEWSIQEPNLKPPSNLLEVTKDSQNSGYEPGVNDDELSDDEDGPTAFNSYTPPSLPDEEETQSSRHPSSASAYFDAPSDDAPPTRASGDMPKLPRDLNLHTVEAEEMEEIIRRQVEKSLEKIAREVLPELAERVIKAEIHRLLSEQP